MLWRKRRKSTLCARCNATIGWSTRCSKPAVAGSELCSFHAGLLGPWAEALRPIPMIRKDEKTSRRIS